MAMAATAASTAALETPTPTTAALEARAAESRLPTMPAFMQYDENAFQFFQRIRRGRLFTGIRIVDDQIKSMPPMNGGENIEIYGGNDTGKTEILLTIVAGCINPKKYGGQETHVVYFDNDFRFNARRLCRIIRQIALRNKGSEDPDWDVVVDESLGRFHLFRCHSSLNFMVTLKCLNLPSVKLDEVSAIFIDSLGSHRDLDKRCCPKRLHTLYQLIANRIRELSKTYGLTIFAAKPVIYSDSSIEYHPTIWPRDLVHLRLLLTPRGTRQVSQRGRSQTMTVVGADLELVRQNSRRSFICCIGAQGITFQQPSSSRTPTMVPILRETDDDS